MPLRLATMDPVGASSRGGSTRSSSVLKLTTGSMALFVAFVVVQMIIVGSFYGYDLKSISSSISGLSTAVTFTTIKTGATNGHGAPPPPFTVFWNFYLPSDDSKRDEILESMHEQLHQVARSSAEENVVLNYVTINNLPMILVDSSTNDGSSTPSGSDSTSTTSTLVDVACSQYPRLTCRHLRHHAKGFEEVTLNELYDYCVAQEEQPSNAYVAYIHNKGSYHAAGWVEPATQREMRKDIWRRHGTAAAVHPACRKHHHQTNTTTTDDGDGQKKCNVCGLLWTPIPWNHAPGNFFATECSYVKRLLRPSHFDFLHNQMFQYVYTPLLDAGKMIATKKFLMGTTRWSMEMWVGSHPSLEPCDLSMEPDIKDWMWQDRVNVSVPINADDGSESIFSFSTFPRPTERDMRTMFVHSEPKYSPALLDQAAMRFRDYNLLGGMIVRWGLYYGMMPKDDSWFWSYYPDGEIWKSGLEKHGMGKVYEVISKPYWDPPK